VQERIPGGGEKTSNEYSRSRGSPRKNEEPRKAIKKGLETRPQRGELRKNPLSPQRPFGENYPTRAKRREEISHEKKRDPEGKTLAGNSADHEQNDRGDAPTYQADLE